MGTFNNVLVGIDLSGNCIPALKQALDVVDLENDSLTCLHIVPESGNEAKSYQKFFDNDGTDEKLLKNHFLPRLEEWLSEIEFGLDKKVDVDIAIGDPGPEMVKYAKESDNDLIVVGTHGRSGVKNFWFGSVAESVVRHAPCPVMTIRAKDPNPGIINE